MLHQSSCFQQGLADLCPNQSNIMNRYPNFVVDTYQGMRFINVSEIVYCQADGNYTKLFLVDGVQILATKKLKEIAAILDYDFFFRIHHSYMVNLNYLESLKNEVGMTVKLSTGKELEVSKRKRSQFLNLFQRL